MGSDFYSPREAARILSRSGKPISERRIRQMLSASELAGEQLDNGRWRIPQDLVHELLEERRKTFRDSVPRNHPMTDAGRTAPERALYGPESVRELLSRVEALSRELGRSEARLELTERAESSIREERDRLRGELELEREERRRLQDRLDRLREPSRTNPGEVSRDASEGVEASARHSEGYGPGEERQSPRSGAERPLNGLRGFISRLRKRDL